MAIQTKQSSTSFRDPGKQYPKVAIIGAGSSGLIACQKLKHYGIPYDCFEKGSYVGGNWVYKNDNGMSAAYRSLHINTSRQQMEFRCFPMPHDYPDFPHHGLIRKYFESFLDHFDLRKTITFNCEVKKATPLAHHRWQLELSNGQKKIYDALIVANGHHWSPRWPDPVFPGDFSGVTMHSHAYLNPEEPHNLKGKRVVILGMGNSAMDIACELGQRGQAEKVFLAARSGVHIMPKYLSSRPADSFMRHPGDKPSWWEYLFPYRLVENVIFGVLSGLIRASVGKPQDYGLPEPRHKFGESHPTISSEIHIRLGSGDVIPKPNLKRLEGKRVVFTDDSSEEVDAIIYATGYNISFPFFDPSVIKFNDNDLALYKRIFDPSQPTLMFLGLVQPLCSIMPVAEVQANLMARYLTGQYALPDPQTMHSVMEQDHGRMKSRYVKSPRHTIQINCQEYTFDLHRELKKGQKRAMIGSTLRNPWSHGLGQLPSSIGEKSQA